MREEIFKIEELINKSGYDTFIKNENIFLIKDGKVTETPIKNINILLHGNVTPKLEDIALLMINNHSEKVKIEEGFYEGAQPISKDKFKELLKESLNKDTSKNEKEEIEKKLDLTDPEIKLLYNKWDNGDCSLVGIVEIYLYQCIKKHKDENGAYYDTDYDQIKLRYGK